LVEEYFDAVSGDEDWGPRYNISPTQPIPVIRQNPREPVRELALVRWGLIPSWAKDPSVAARMINARSETAAAKPAFRDALRFRRCLVPADGFYEWSRSGKAKQPYCFEVNEGELFVFAGLWDRWGRGRQDHRDLLDPDQDPERGDIARPRPDAGHPRSRRLRPVARSGDEGCGLGVRIVEAL
jgi:putative SOS response-associated peptidase YedK